MILPLSWVRDYADITTTPDKFAELMTMSGSKVEGFECLADEIKNVVIGKILSLEKHPDSDHLWICSVDIGTDAPTIIVTGAQNLKVGDLCPAALDNSRLPGGVKIRKGKLRGVESNGMLCSLGELKLTINDFPNCTEDGIMTLDTDVAVGTNAAIALGLDDVAVEFEITPNRPDCLSVLGLAREAAATYGVPFTAPTPKLPTGEGDIADMLKVSINTDICSRYVGAAIKNVKVKPSPQWLRQRLRLAGVRPINNIVDITNYVMLEYGQPMHAFDYSYVKGQSITVRPATNDEKITTLDGVERTLSSDMCVIADDNAAIAVAGVMGGEFSGIYDTTNTVIFESACFNGPSVRVTAKKLGMRTESSGRYEKGLNPENCLPAITRAIELIRELDAGDIVNGVIDIYPAPRKERSIPLRPEVINKLLGTSVTEDEMIKILLPLGFIVNKNADGTNSVVVPSERFDVERDCDIAEEVCRFIGYNKIPSTIMRGVATARPTPRQIFHKKIINALIGYGFYECETFSFYGKKSWDSINLPENDPLRNAIIISNPLGEDTSIMRTTALPSLLEVVARNYNARADEVAIFENATEYIPSATEDTLPQENEKIIISAYGKNYDYASIKGVVEKLLYTAGISNAEYVINAEGTSYHPGRTADIMLGDVKIGMLGEIHPTVLSNYSIKPRTYAADINFDLLFEHSRESVQFKPLPRHPATTRDLAIICTEDIAAAQLVKCIEKGAGKLLESLTLFDVYRGDNIESGKKSLAYSLVLRTAEKTLTDEEADTVVKKVLKNLAEIGAQLRS